jgi:hypothetical protein
MVTSLPEIEIKQLIVSLNIEISNNTQRNFLKSTCSAWTYSRASPDVSLSKAKGNFSWSLVGIVEHSD